MTHERSYRYYGSPDAETTGQIDMSEVLSSPARTSAAVYAREPDGTYVQLESTPLAPKSVPVERRSNKLRLIIGGAVVLGIGAAAGYVGANAGHHDQTPQATTSAEATPSPSASVVAVELPSSSASASASAKVSPSASASSSPSAIPSASPSRAILLAPKPHASAAPTTHKPSPKPSPTHTQTPAPKIVCREDGTANQKAGGSVAEYHCDGQVSIFNTGTTDYMAIDIGVNIQDEFSVNGHEMATAFSASPATGNPATGNQVGDTGLLDLTTVQLINN